MGKVRFTYQAGLIDRGAIRREIENYCFLQGYNVRISEDKGLLCSSYRVVIDVPDERVEVVTAALKKWFAAIEYDV